MRGEPRPRDYQVEAARWALERGRAVVCMPTGTGKTLIAALWIKKLLGEGRARRILVLEPTRFLVEQVAGYLRGLGIPAAPVHGSLPPWARERGWRSRVVVATPEIVVAEAMEVAAEADALVVDECHHTTGQDAYAKVARAARARWRLGLTPYVPPSRRREIEEHIGEVRCWSWSDPRLAPYIPRWAGEVYESPLNEAEERLYRAIEEAWASRTGRERALLGLALRWLARDGALALRESYEKGGALRRILGGLEALIYDERVRPAHKLPSLRRVLADHEGFTKAIVFVDRVSIAGLIASSLRSLNPVTLVGRRHGDPAAALEAARRPESRLVVATSAGEEGIDMPEADLLVIWSNTASPLRFIQRLGRLLRARGGGEGGQKYAVFIATPDTVDVDSLVYGIAEAEKAGVALSVSAEAVKALWEASRLKRILDAIEENPAPSDLIARALGAPPDKVEAALRWLASRGYALYIHTGVGRVYASRSPGGLEALRRRYAEYLTPDEGVVARVEAETPTGPLRPFKASYQAALERLARIIRERGPLKALRFAVRARYGAIETVLRASYTYPIDSPDVLDLVVRNAYSMPRWRGPPSPRWTP